MSKANDDAVAAYGRIFDETLKHLEEFVAVVVKETTRDSSKEMFFEHVDLMMTLAANAVMKGDQGPAMSALFGLKVLLHVARGNPIFDSPALALQMRSAGAVILEKYRHDREKSIVEILELTRKRKFGDTQ